MLLEKTKAHAFHGLSMPFWLYVDRAREVSGGWGGGIFCIGEGEIGYNILRWVLNHTILKYKSYDICLSQNHMSEMDPDNYEDTVK